MMDPWIIRLEVERLQTGMSMAIADIIKEDYVNAAIQKAISEFDFETEVNLRIKQEIQIQVQRRVEWAIREKVNKLADKAIASAKELSHE